MTWFSALFITILGIVLFCVPFFVCAGRIAELERDVLYWKAKAEENDVGVVDILGSCWCSNRNTGDSVAYTGQERLA